MSASFTDWRSQVFFGSCALYGALVTILSIAEDLTDVGTVENVSAPMPLQSLRTATGGVLVMLAVFTAYTSSLWPYGRTKLYLATATVVNLAVRVVTVCNRTLNFAASSEGLLS